MSTTIQPGLSHPDRAMNAAISRALFESITSAQDLIEIRHTFQVTSFGGSGTTALCEHLAAHGVDLPPTPGCFPFKHQRRPPESAAVPRGFRAIYLVGDPRDAVVSVFRRGLQDGHYIGMRMSLPPPEVESRLATLAAFAEAGIDDFLMADHLAGWTSAVDRGYPIVLVRTEALHDAWPDFLDSVDLPRDIPPLPRVTRSSDWREMPAQVRSSLDCMYGRLAERISSMPALEVVSGSRPPTRRASEAITGAPEATAHAALPNRTAARSAAFSVTFVVPSTKRPIGGVMALLEFAGALARRGHRVCVAHAPTIKGHIDKPSDLAWIDLDPGIEHLMLGGCDPDDLPSSDFVELTGLLYFAAPSDAHAVVERAQNRAGLPFVFVQGWSLYPRQVELAVLRAACPKVCVATWLMRRAREEGVPAAHLSHVPYGLRHDKYRVTIPVESRPAQVSMLYGVHPLKGAEHGLAALREVRRRVPGARLVAFGNQEPVHEIPAQVEYLRDPSQHVLVDEVYNRSRVFLSPSVIEGFGFCPVEAMACGAAIVTASNGGSADYAFDGENALVVPPGDVTAMADSIESLLLDDVLRTRLASAGREFVTRFDWGASGERLEAFLRAYAADPGALGAASSRAAG